MRRIQPTSRYQCFIGGRWCEPASGQYFESIDPFLAEPWALIPRCDARDVDAAVLAARTALEHGEWANMHPSRRGQLLRRFGELIERDADRLASVEVQDNGKLYAEMRGQLGYVPHNTLEGSLTKSKEASSRQTSRTCLRSLLMNLSELLRRSRPGTLR